MKLPVMTSWRTHVKTTVKTSLKTSSTRSSKKSMRTSLKKYKKSRDLSTTYHVPLNDATKTRRCSGPKARGTRSSRAFVLLLVQLLDVISGTFCHEHCPVSQCRRLKKSSNTDVLNRVCRQSPQTLISMFALVSCRKGLFPAQS